MITYISNDIHNGLFILLLNSRLTLFLLIIDNDYTINIYYTNANIYY
jgi:hypothetical protein